jgi:DNA primase
MAKVSPVSIKYIIKAKFIANGTIEKPDVIGAVFGQTEGLLGEDMDLRELQKQGKIGRIEVESKSEEGQTEGEITIPTSLDKTETTLIAAAIETIEKIGPSEAKIKIEGIEDVRSNKREYILERAKTLMQNFSAEGMNTDEISENLKTSSRAARIQSYGVEELPAGNLDGEEIIVVEGRADVVNMLKNNINNVIGMNGSVLPETIKHLGESKILTLFCDGDRGGLLIVKNVTSNANIQFIAFAPDGKEVEELTGKEILIALRKKIPFSEFFKNSNGGGDKREYSRGREYKREERSYGRREKRYSEKPEESKEVREKRNIKELSEDELIKLQNVFEEIIGTRAAVLFSEDFDVLKKVPLSELSHFLKKYEGKVFALVIDGIATGSLIRLAEESSVNHLAARNFADFKANINLISL